MKGVLHAGQAALPGIGGTVGVIDEGALSFWLRAGAADIGLEVVQDPFEAGQIAPPGIG